MKCWRDINSVNDAINQVRGWPLLLHHCERALASNCNFGFLADEMIRDQIVEKIASDKVRERLLSEPKLTLDKCISIATRLESTEKEVKDLSHSFSPVCHVKKKPKFKCCIQPSRFCL